MVNTTTPTLPWQSYSVKAAEPIRVPKTVILRTTDWINNVQTVSVDAVSNSNIVIVSPTPESYLAYSQAVCRCISQGDGTLTFRCGNSPGVNLSINVLILN